MLQSRDQHRYHPFYCEENIWHLYEDVGDLKNPTVIIISNDAQTVAVAEQAAGGDHGTVVWDYHVVLAGQVDDAWRIWDFDTKLSFPVAATEWLFQSFERFIELPPEYFPRFRVLPADVYRREFGSDRRHMKQADGTWRSPPPDWPAPGSEHSLNRLIDMQTPHTGELLDHMGMRSWFSR